MPEVMNESQILRWLKDNRTKLDGYSYYLGDEVGIEKRSWEKSDLRICFIFSGPYETASGNLAVPILCGMAEDHFPNVYADRAYFPSTRADLERMKRDGVPIFGVESKHSLKDFDVLCFSLSYCVPVPMTLTMMHLAGITLETKDRGEDEPLIVGGGHSYHSYTNIDPAVDVVAGGDGEHLLPQLIESWLEIKKAGKTRLDLKMKLATGYKGFYVPEFYDWGWKENGDIEYIRPNRTGIPLRVKVSFFEDWDKRWLYTKPFIPFGENQMFLGQLLVSKGCENKCSFCAETFTDGPYREMKGVTAFNAMKDIYKYSGTQDVTPSAYTFGSFTDKKWLMLNLQNYVTDKVNLISERINDFADGNLAEIAGQVGDRTISFGFEGNSERMRRRFNKNITEEQIIAASAGCMKAGYQKIKYFMISNPPLETEEDIMEIVQMAEKLAALKAEIGAKTELMFSWTQMVISAVTPMQWFNIWQCIEARKMGPVIPHLKRLGLNFRFGSGGVLDEAYFQPLVQMGDRRLYPIMKRLALLEGFVFYGNVPGGIKAKLDVILPEYGLSWDMFFKEKAQDQIFSHEIFDTGVKRWYLWKEYKRYCTDPVTESGRCLVKCEACGACSKDSLKLMMQYKNNQEPDIPLSEFKPILQRGRVKNLRIKFFTDQDHVGVANAYWKSSFRRASNILEFPLSKNLLEYASDDIKTAVRVSGVNYTNFAMYRGIDEDLNLLKKRFNEELRHVRILDMRPADDGQLIRTERDSVIYRIGLPLETAMVQDRIRKFLDYAPIEGVAFEEMDLSTRTAYMKANPQVTRIEVPDYAKGTVRIMIDTRPLVLGMMAVPGRVHQTEMLVWLRGLIVPQHLMEALFKMPMSEAARLDTRRMEYLVKYKDEETENLFDPACPSCDMPYVQNLFYDSVKFGKDEHCIRCLFGENYTKQSGTRIRIADVVTAHNMVQRKKDDEKFLIKRAAKAAKLAASAANVVAEESQSPEAQKVLSGVGAATTEPAAQGVNDSLFGTSLEYLTGDKVGEEEKYPDVDLT